MCLCMELVLSLHSFLPCCALCKLLSWLKVVCAHKESQQRSPSEKLQEDGAAPAASVGQFPLVAVSQCRFSCAGLPVPAALWLETPGNTNLTGSTSCLASRLSHSKPWTYQEVTYPVWSVLRESLYLNCLASVCFTLWKYVEEERGSLEEWGRKDE